MCRVGLEVVIGRPYRPVWDLLAALGPRIARPFGPTPSLHPLRTLGHEKFYSERLALVHPSHAARRTRSPWSRGSARCTWSGCRARARPPGRAPAGRRPSGRAHEDPLPNQASAGVPILVMIRIDTANIAAESVTSPPTGRCCRRAGPCKNGITYMVRPRMQPPKISANVLRISAGRDPVVGRARVLFPLRADEGAILNPCHITRVRAHQKLFGRSFGFSRMNPVLHEQTGQPLPLLPPEPSHQMTSSGLVSSAIP